MVCIYCGSATSVTNSRRQKRSNQVWRRRRCSRCLAVFTTHETIEMATSLLVQPKLGPASPFLGDRLFTEILLALQDRPNCYRDAREITFTVVKELLKQPSKPFFSPLDISKVTARVLKRFDRQAYLRYQAEHPSLITS